MVDETDSDHEEKDLPVNSKGELPTLDAEAEDFIEEANEDRAAAASAGVFVSLDDSKLPEPIGLLASEEDTEEDDDEPPVKPKRLTKKQKNAAIVERIRSCRKEMLLAGRLPKKKKRV